MSTDRKILIVSFPRARGEKNQKKDSRQLSARNLRLYTRLLRRLGYRFTTVSEALRSPPGKYCCLTFDAADDHARVLLPYLHSWKIPGTLFITTDDVNTPNSSGFRFTWKKLRRLMKWKWEIGTYGRSFVDLTTVSHLEQLEQIRSASDAISARLGQRPSSFAYAYGAYDTSVLKVLKDCAFRAGVSSTAGINDHNTSRLQLQRVRMSGKLAWDLLGIMRWTSHKPKVGRGVPHVTSREGATTAQRSPA